MVLVRAFISGFLAVLVFHQVAIALLYSAGIVPVVPYDMSPTAPFGVPGVLSLSFWGGVWGLVLYWFLRHAAGGAYWLRALVIGAVGPTAVALLVVFPLKGIPVSVGVVVIGLIVNAAWGMGTALLLLAFRKVVPETG